MLVVLRAYILKNRNICKSKDKYFIIPVKFIEAEEKQILLIGITLCSV